MDTSHLPIHEQILRFRAVIEHNKTLLTVLQRAATMKLPGWYLASGALSQTVWNVVTHRDPELGTNDYDLVYFDALDLSGIFADMPVEVQIRNQARVHLWSEEKFGNPCPQHTSSEAAISAWGINSALYGIRLMEDGQWNIYAPWGFSDMFSLVVRPNQQNMTEERYNQKVER
ncbi:putative fad binding domain protein [Eutypa lata UCREL1]|uniref:Putative fad binding domain protein n=1 Tax=Eutypa lata (strain UCR-EL1) TaxID=1287681 RepID=M7SDZ4_EUTLA|nr:putative fad binding domain protein [Eutypa lata UCREL1]